MKIKRILSGEYVENCYICSDDDKNCFIVDPGEGFDKISEYIESNELKISFILLTHGHGDHIASAEKLKKRFQTEIFGGIEEKEVFENSELNFTSNMSMGDMTVNVDRYLKDDDEIDFLGKIIKVIHTPGHTKGGVCYLFENILFSGDSLFKGTIGRTDLPTGDYDDLISSLKQKILTLDKDIKVYPGHGFATTIGEELENNLFLK